MIALYCLIKSNKTNRNDDWMMIGIDQLDPSCVSNRFKSLCVHVASYRKFPRKDRKTSEGCCRTPTVQLSSWSELLADSGYLDLLGLRKHVKRVSGRRTLLTVGFRESTWTEMLWYTQTISSWMFKLAWGAAYSLKNTSGFRISGHLPTCKRIYKGDIEIKTETAHN